jgi:tRNA(Ile)-lysidine synthase
MQPKRCSANDPCGGYRGGVTPRPRLTPAIADARRAVREALAHHSRADSVTAVPASATPERPVRPLRVIVALSGGADSLALAAAAAFAAPRLGFAVAAVIVDHGLQVASAQIAVRAATQARELGLDPVLVVRANISAEPGNGGPEAAARSARYELLEQARTDLDAQWILTGHTRDDQAEQVLLGLARGSGTRSLAGIPPQRAAILRPFLALPRSVTLAACADAGLTPWADPHNSDRKYARVRVRDKVLPLLEAELGPGIAAALARTAEIAREDAEAFAEMVAETLAVIAQRTDGGISVSVPALAAHPAALRHRIIRAVAQQEFDVQLDRTHTLAVANLVTRWHGQGTLALPGIRVRRAGDRLVFQSTHADEPAPSQALRGSAPQKNGE